jgi:SOS-response transcriptional repressor LexA
MGTTIKERTIEFIKYKKISVKEFEIRCGMSNGYVSSMRKGFGADKLGNVLSAFPELNRDWLIYGEGEMISSPSPPSSPPNERKGMVMVPKFSGDGRGGPGFNQEVDTDYYIESYIPFSNEIAREGDVAITIYGDSMEPVYREGSLVLIRRIDMWREYIDLGRTYVVELMDERRMIKIVKAGSDAEHLLLASINPAFEPQEVSKSFIRSVWMVIASVRREEI